MKKLFTVIMFLFSTLLFTNAMSEGKPGNVSDIEGDEVIDSSGAVVGEVDRVANSKSMEAMVIIGLRDSQKEVAVPLSSVKVAADGKVSINSTRAQLEAQEDIDPLDYTVVNPTPNADD